MYQKCKKQTIFEYSEQKLQDTQDLGGLKPESYVNK